jgi:hypothetical protein
VLRLDDGKVKSTSDPATRARQGFSLIAFHGPAKPEPVRRLVEDAVARLGSALANFPGLFRRYPLDQVHATILGLEGTRAGDALVNLNARAREQAHGLAAEPMDLRGLVDSLLRHPWPLPIRFGGHSPDTCNPYDPRPPWERTFDVREDGLAVLIGWPWSEGSPFAPSLLGLRKLAERHGVVHKYHVDPAARDNDLFLVVGGIDARALQALGEHRPAAMAALELGRGEVRRWLERTPLEVELAIEHLSVVEYRSTTLEEVSFERPLGAVDPAQLIARYRPG